MTQCNVFSTTTYLIVKQIYSLMSKYKFAKNRSKFWPIRQWKLIFRQIKLSDLNGKTSNSRVLDSRTLTFLVAAQSEGESAKLILRTLNLRVKTINSWFTFNNSKHLTRLIT